MATANPQRDKELAYLTLNQQAASQHKTEDFQVGEHVYIWAGTFAGTTTAVVKEAKSDSPTVTIDFEDPNLPEHLLGRSVSITPYELMHLGEFKSD